jgi:hypothetical protein
LHHYFRKEYAEAVDYFRKSLEMNSFQLETLLRLGYSAIQIEAWDVAASTYWKYCSYETEVRTARPHLHRFLWQNCQQQ